MVPNPPGNETNEIMDRLMVELQYKAVHNIDDIRERLIIPAFQQICYYKISVFKTALTMAIQLELDMVVDLIQQIIDWEKKTDSSLMNLAYRELSKSSDTIPS